MIVALKKSEIEKMVNHYVPYCKVVRWDNDDVYVDVRIDKLEEDNIRGINIYRFKKKVLVEPIKYVIYPILKKDKEEMVVTFQ